MNAWPIFLALLLAGVVVAVVVAHGRTGFSQMVAALAGTAAVVAIVAGLVLVLVEREAMRRRGGDR